MAVNRRYLSSPWRQTSSLYRAAQSAKNLQDEEMKFKWDFEQISNEDYLKYVNKRAKEQTDPSDVMKWARNTRTVEREIRSDMRARDFLRISTMGDSSAAKSKAKVDAYWRLAEAAYKDGDNDAYVSAITAYNNAFTAYENKLASEARAGSSSAKKALNKSYQLKQNDFNDRENTIKNEFSDDPLKMAGLLAQLYIEKSIAATTYANGVGQYEDTENKFDDTVLQAKKFGQKALAFAEKVLGDFDTDKDGNITGFTPKTLMGPDGTEILQAGEGYAKVITPQGMRLVKNGTAYGVSFDANGEATMLSEKAPDNNNLQEVVDPDTGETYYSEVQYNKTEPTFDPKTGLYKSPMVPQASMSQKEIDKKRADGSYQDTRFIIDQQGYKRAWNAATNKFDLYANRGDLEQYAKAIDSKKVGVYAEGLGLSKANPKQNPLMPAMLPQAKLKTGTSYTDKAGLGMTGGGYELPQIAGRPLRLPEASATQIRDLNTPGGEGFTRSLFPEVEKMAKARELAQTKKMMDKKQKASFDLAEANKRKAFAAQTLAKKARSDAYDRKLEQKVMAKVPRQLQKVAKPVFKASLPFAKNVIGALRKNTPNVNNQLRNFKKKDLFNPVKTIKTGWNILKGFF